MACGSILVCHARVQELVQLEVHELRRELDGAEAAARAARAQAAGAVQQVRASVQALSAAALALPDNHGAGAECDECLESDGSQPSNWCARGL